MKRLVLLALLCGGIAAAFSGDYDDVRVKGVNTIAGGTYYVGVDSSDTFKVDTVFSDTIEIGDYKWINIAAQVLGYGLADSANDSVEIIVKAFVTQNGSMKLTVLDDSLNATAGALDSTVEYIWVIRVDTLGANQLYFQTVISDSFIAGIAQTGNDDSNRFKIRYQVTQTGSR